MERTVKYVVCHKYLIKITKQSYSKYKNVEKIPDQHKLKSYPGDITNYNCKTEKFYR